MNIGINLLYLRPSKVGGSEIYIRELIRHLDRINEVNLVLFCYEDVAKTFNTLNRAEIRVVSTKKYSQLNRFINENFSLRKYLKEIDLVFSPSNFAPPLLPANIPQVVTVFDLQHLWLKENFSFYKRTGRSLFFKASFMKCRQVITIGEFTRKDIIRRFNVSSGLVTTVYCGVDTNFNLNEHHINNVLTRYNINNEYFIYPAMLLPHKNHYFLIDAFSKFKKETKNKLELLFTGDKKNCYHLLDKHIKSSGLSSSVRHLGYLRHEEVLALMSKAKALLFPSKFEGFGLPILEAMICGTPVIASNATTIPEVAGDAALLLDPDDLELWSGAMKKIIINGDLSKSLLEKGYDNVKKFSWELCAEQTLDVFKKVLAN